MDIKGFSPDEAQRLIRSAHMIRPEDPRLAIGADALERLGALRHLLLLLEASIGSQNLCLRLYEDPGEAQVLRSLACVEAIELLERFAADPGGEMSIERAVDAALGKARVNIIRG